MNLDKPQNILIIAKSNSGKSYWMCYHVNELLKKKKISNVIVMSSTCFNGSYDGISKKEYQFENINSKYILALLKSRAKAIENKKKITPIALVLDDIVGDKQIRNSVIDLLFSRSRHYQIYVFLSIQAPKLISPTVRSNSSKIVLFKPQNNELLDTLYQLCPISDTFSEFKKIVQEYVHSYRCLVFDQNYTGSGNENFHIEKAPSVIDYFYHHKQE